MNMEVRDVALRAPGFNVGEVFSPAYNRLKRGFDVILCVLILPFLLPFMALIAVLVKLDGGPVFYTQSRVGRAGRMFGCLKFRTMVPNAERKLEQILKNDPAAREEWARDFKLRNDPRITLIGHFLRRTSLDELPQIVNVLRGEMSLVGPRPVTHHELELYGEHAGWYLACMPGITGRWRVSARNDLSYARRVAMDVRYALTWSLLLDLNIIVRTVPAVVSSRGAY